MKTVTAYYSRGGENEVEGKTAGNLAAGIGPAFELTGQQL